MSTERGSPGWGESSDRSPTHLFLDTEFLETSEGILYLSIALISDVGHAFYSEMPLAEARDLLAPHPNPFVLENVLSQFEVKQGELWHELPERLSKWFDSLNVREVNVVYDYSADFLFVEQLLERMETLPAITLHATHIGYLANDLDGKIAAASCWAAVKSVEGIDRHHALADTYALRAKFEAVHGWLDGSQDDPPIPIGEPFGMVAVVTAVIEMFEVAHADTAGGRTLSIGAETQGVRWRDLREGQTLICECIANPNLRVVRATIKEPIEGNPSWGTYR